MIASRKSPFLSLAIHPHDHTKSPDEDAANRTKQILSDMTSEQQRLKVTANQVAYLPSCFFCFGFLLFFKGMDQMRSGERMSARQAERRKTEQERWAATWQLRVI